MTVPNLKCGTQDDSDHVVSSFVHLTLMFCFFCPDLPSLLPPSVPHFHKTLFIQLRSQRTLLVCLILFGAGTN